MKAIKRITALLLAAVLLSMTAQNSGAVFAAEVSNMEGGNLGESAEDVSDSVEQEEVLQEQTEPEEKGNVRVEDVVRGEAAQTEADEGDITSNGLINYVYVEQPYLESVGIQKIAISYGNGTENITDVLIRCENSSGLIYDIPMTKQEDNLYLFEHEFTAEEKGTYSITEFFYMQNGVENTIDLKTIGVEAQFGVDEYYPGYFEGEDSVDPSEIEVSVVDVDADNVVAAETDVEQALQETEAEIERIESHSYSSYAVAPARSASNIVVVLDPGHGGEDSGAVGYGLYEKNLNLAIATYCKKELEEYSGVTVKMTRDEDVRLGSDAASDLETRVNRAASWGADLMVSIHINSGGGTGAEVYYPNSNYNSAVGSQGHDAARLIQNELVKLNLADRGIKVRTCVEDKYSDGSLQDYYGIIRRSKLKGFPGIIIEHAFIDNAGDAAKLKNNSFLEQCGIADATGIANYFGLAKGRWETDKDGNTYYYLNDQPAKGEKRISGYWYYFDESTGKMATGWTKHHNNQYYYDEQGRMQFGEKKIDGFWYYFSENNGVMATGMVTHHGNQYYYNEQGRMQFGVQKIGGKTYYFSERNGILVKGEVCINSAWYYFDEKTGEMATGLTKHHGNQYYYDENGQMKFGIQKIDGETYYLKENNGTMFKGEIRINNAWYYFDEKTGKMATGLTVHHGNQYYYDDEGQMQFGDQLLDGIWYYFSKRNGVLEGGGIKRGEQFIDGYWYYFDEKTGKMATGWTEHHGNRYYYDENGHMKFGEICIDKHWYYLSERNGVLATGITSHHNQRYYYSKKNDELGQMKFGFQTIDGKTYYFKENNGTMVTGESRINGEWYYFNETTGEMATGLTRHHGNQYYYNEQGQMQFGYQEINGVTYYFNLNNGVLESKTLIMGNSNVTAEQLKAFFENEKKSYPSYYVSHDEEAINILRFCQIYIEECRVEGIRPEVAFAQAMLETGYLTFTGDVDISQFNFAGIGATGGGNPGNRFKNVRQGIRAQVQHLKCYASTDSLNQERVDPRWNESLRGKAPYVEWLSIPNNPYHTGWAADPNYAIKLNTIISKICSTK